MEHNIAFLVMTYNHPDTVEEVLAHTVELYDRYGMDIYYFDSSETEDTKAVIDSYIKNHAENLYYISTNINIIDNRDKINLALSGKHLKKHYDYVFLIKDRSYFDELTIKKLHEAAQNSYDAILLPTCHWPYDVYPQPETEIYTDPVLFFRDYGAYTPNMECVLFNYDTMLKDVDWDAFKARYFQEGESYFEQMILLFTGLARLDNPKIRVLREGEVIRFISKHSNSMWWGQVFDLWARRWPIEVDMLPECYDEYKPYIKKKETMQDVLFGSPYPLIVFAQNKILTKQVAEQVKDVWTDVSDIPYECLEYILDGRQDLLKKRLAREWLILLRGQNFPQAYHMFRTNYWLKELYGSYVHDTLAKCFEIYKMELEKGIDEGIFKNVYSVDDAVNKYQTVKYMLRRLEYDVADNIVESIIPYCMDQKITVQCLSYLIQQECVNEEKVLSCWEYLSDIYRKGK